jgi:hypothetical protein
MESTGVYWKPVYNILESEGIELIVVNAQHIKAVPGRKTDVKDAEWIADLVRHGLVKASFVPSREQRELREMVRCRNEIINERIKQFPLLKDSVDKYRNAIEYLYDELSKEITLARGFYEEYGYSRKDAAEEIKKFKYPQVGFWALNKDGDANDYIQNLRENKYFEMLDNIVANSE